jgi:peptidoglycan/LPS O-acetylase OafA/YrhL
MITRSPAPPGIRVDHLQIVRAFAAFCVLTQHTLWSLHPRDWPVLFTVGSLNLSWIPGGCDTTGVFLFFCLSGYLMGKGFFRGRYDPARPWRFYWRRFFRIVPAYVFYLFCAFTAGGLLVRATPADIALGLQSLLTLTYDGTQGVNDLTGHLWSISTEMQFYAIVPIFAFIFAQFCKKLSQRNVLIVIGLVLAAGFCNRYIIWLPHRFGYWHVYAYVSVWSNLDLFLSGVLLNFVEFKPLTLPFPRQVALLFASITVMYLTCSYITYYSRVVAPDFTGWFTYGLSTISAIFALWLIYVGERMNARGMVTIEWGRLLRPLAYAGTLTFSFYLWHEYLLENVQAWLEVADHPLMTYLARIVLVGAGAGLMAVLSYELIEGPFLHLKFPSWSWKAARATAREGSAASAAEML